MKKKIKKTNKNRINIVSSKNKKNVNNNLSFYFKY